MTGRRVNKPPPFSAETTFGGRGMKYIVKRILQAIPLLLIITFICFMLINLAPYDAIDSITTPDMTKQEDRGKARSVWTK